MAGRRGQHTDSDSAPRGSFPSLRVAGPPALLLAIPEAAQAESIDLGGRAAALLLGAAAGDDPQRRHPGAVSRPHRCRHHPCRAPDARTAALGAARPRASTPRWRACAPSRIVAALFGSERQLLISWSGRDGEPRFEGDPSVAGEGATAKRALAFGGWLAPADAAAVEGALDHLRHRGEAFRLTARTLAHAFVDVEGRTLGGSAHPAPARRHRRPAPSCCAPAPNSGVPRRSARADGARSTPSRIRSGSATQPSASRWANQAYPARRRGERASRTRRRAPSSCSTGRPARRRAAAVPPAPPSMRASRPVIGGQRHVLDVRGAADRRTAAPASPSTSPNSRRCAPTCSARWRRMLRTLDQLPTAVAIFDGGQTARLLQRRLSRPVAARAGLPRRSADGRRGARPAARRRANCPSRPISVPGRRMLAAYHAVEPRETWWHLPDRRTLRVVTNPNPARRRHLSLRRRQRAHPARDRSSTR